LYFLLAAAGAGIGFAVTQSQQATIAWSKLPLAIAVVCWGLSFIFGCKQLRQTNNILQKNYQMLRVQKGIHPVLPPTPEVLAFIEKDLEESSSSSGGWGRLQFSYLVAGAIFFVLWHVIEMALRTPGLIERTGLHA
jgi:hypothetical protein